jgi:hypothetical protein
VAGIIFAGLFMVSTVLIGLAMSENLPVSADNASIRQNSALVSVALTLVPFAGIAFLCFLGVVRNRLGTFIARGSCRECRVSHVWAGAGDAGERQPDAG